MCYVVIGKRFPDEFHGKRLLISLDGMVKCLMS